MCDTDKMPNPVDFPPKPPASLGDLGDSRQPLVACAGDLDAGMPIGPHAFPRAQLAFCFDGLMRVEIGDDRWFTPDRHGIWIPPGESHLVTTGSPIELQTFYIHPRQANRSGTPPSDWRRRILAMHFSSSAPSP